LFTDLVREDADFLADIEGEARRRAHFRLLQETVASEGGSPARNLGDGLLVVFPSAVQALRTAIALQQAVERHNRTSDDRLAVRVGLHVGEPIGDEADYFGRPVVAARHVCASAQAAQIVASQLVRSLVGGRGEFQFADRAPLTLPGVADPLATVEIQWRTGTGGRAKTEAPLPPALADVDAFVGREVELAKLREIWERTKPGSRPQVAMVAGEPGVGKTRLVAELAREAHAEGALVLFGRCDEEPLTPYDPVVQALTWYVDNWPPAEVASQLGPLGGELMRLVPLMGERVPGLTPPPQGDADTDRYRLFEAVSGLLENISRDQPVVLVLDDLQWADKATLLLLRHVVRSATGGGLLAVGTYRDVDLTRAHPLVETLAELRRQQVIERIALTGLGEMEVAELVGTLTSTAMSPEVSAALHRETEGNPFFVREMLQHLIDTHTVAGDGSISVEDIGVPESVRELIGRRLLRLSNETNDLLAEASAIGRQFDLEILAAVNGGSPEEVLETLEEAMTARLVTEVVGQVDRFAFSHVLVHETLYLEVSTIRRARLHGRVAAALEERYGEDPGRLAELAHHYYEAARAGVTDKAVEYCRRAGDRALSHLAYEEAAGHYERALQVLELDGDTSDQQRGLLHVTAGEAWRRAGERERARAAFLRAIDIGRALGDGEMVAEAALGLGTGLSAHESFDVSGTTDDAVVAVLEEALAMLPDADTSIRARLLGRLAVAIYWVAPRERRKELSEAAVAMAERTGDEVARVATLVSRYYALWGPEYMEDRLRSAEEILRIAQQTGQTKRVLDARLFRIMAMFELGDVQQADAEIAAFRSEAADLRQPYYLWYAAMLPATRALLDGSFVTAEKLAEEALAVGESAQDPAAIVIYGAQMLWSWREQGRTAELEVAMGSILDVAGAMPIAHVAMAWVSAELGQLDAARKQLESLKGQEANTSNSAPGWMAGTMMTAELAYVLDDAEYAATVYRLLQPYAGHTVMVWLAFCAGPVDYYLGLLAVAMGDVDMARNHFDSAGRLARAMGARPMVARIEHAHAKLLLGAGTRTGDPDPAVFMDRAGGIAKELGMAPLAAAVEALRLR
jgi:tetratricopeptide (TPR) repeat protein